MELHTTDDGSTNATQVSTGYFHLPLSQEVSATYGVMKSVCTPLITRMSMSLME
jgi:hypothetical protein